MRKTLQILILLAFGLTISAQNVKLNSDLNFESTDVKISEYDSVYSAFSSFDNGNSDSLTVTISNIGKGGVMINIILSDKPNVELIEWSDYNQFDGKSTREIGLENYTLELNDTVLRKGERIMGRIKGKSKMITSSLGDYQVQFDGTFSHIIGKLMKKKTADEKYRIIENR